MLSPPRLIGVLVGLVLLVSGGALGAVEYATLADYEATTGTVEHAGIDNASQNSSRDTLPVNGIGEARVYSPNVSYTYTVDGETYTGSNVATGTEMMMADRNRLDAVLESVRPGSQTVYYNPANPTDAHLMQRLPFFPAGLLALCGFLAVTDSLTTRMRLIRLITSWVPLTTLERVPGVETAMPTGAIEDPTAILTAKRTWAGTDLAPFRGRSAAAIWVLCYLFIIDIILAYFLLSAPPYDIWAALAALVVPVGFARLGYTHILD